MKDKKQPKTKKNVFLEYVIVIATAFVLVFGFMKPFVIDAYAIPSESMENTLLVGDRILVAKFIYGIKFPGTDICILDFTEPKIGDIFVFQPPPQAGKKSNFIKRVVGVPGDVIEIRNGELIRNGEYVKEDYIKRINTSPLRYMNFGPVRVPEGHVFAMGDNRDNSNDSRFWGFVPYKNIRGRALIRFWSWDRNADLLHKIRFSRIGRIIK